MCGRRACVACLPMKFDKLTIKSQEAVAEAQAHASSRGHTAIEPAHLLRALEQDDECFPANLYLGALLLGKGQARRALSHFREAHKADALHQTTSVLLAYALLQTGNSKKAEKLVRSVLKTDPGDLTARLCLAEIQLARKQRKAAIESLLKIYEGDNENVRAKELLFNLGY